MFAQIRITNLGVIAEATLDLHPGLNVLTGETGAGKTLVVSGLGMLLGARGDAGLVRTGADRLTVEGIVELPEGHPALVRAADAGADVTDDLVLVRSIAASGRGRAHVGGRTVPLGVLTDLSEHLVAVHGQADQWRLRRPEEHRTVLDAYGGAPVAQAQAEYESAFDEYRSARAELDDLRAQERDRAETLGLLEYQLAQITEVDPQPGEDEELRVEDDRLGHATELLTAAGSAHAALSGDESGLDAPSVLDLLGAARHAVAPVLGNDADLAALDTRLGEVQALAADLAADLAGYTSSLETDPARLAWVQQRRADLGSVTARYGGSVEAVLAHARDAATKVAALQGADDRIAVLEGDLERLRLAAGKAAAALTDLRADAAARLGAAVTAELTHLAMPKAVVVVQVTQSETTDDADGLPLPDGRTVTATKRGVDIVEILLAANPDTPPRSVIKAASGGELSRVMLAIEVALGAPADGVEGVPTFVFDEVDAGVGGAAALDVGARLAALAQHAQVIVVTHLAQVAAHADRHLIVHKETSGDITASGVRTLDEDERVAELARMMSGDDGATALKHARELLSSASRRNR